jgi:hypothetical protein
MPATRQRSAALSPYATLQSHAVRHSRRRDDVHGALPSASVQSTIKRFHLEGYLSKLHVSQTARVASQPVLSTLVEPLLFFVSRLGDGICRSLVATRESGLGIGGVIRGRHRGVAMGYSATLKSAATYLLIAGAWQVMEDELIPLALVSSFVIGAVIAPGLAPWLRMFPVTGDPSYGGWRRLLDMSANTLFLVTSTAAFLYCFKLLVTGLATPVTGAFQWPHFFAGSAGLVIANYLRKLATESLGVSILLPRHPLGPELLERALHGSHKSPRHARLLAWNDLRETPGPGLVGLLLRGWGKPPRGYRSLIDESKMIDPSLAGLIDHFLR